MKYKENNHLRTKLEQPPSVNNNIEQYTTAWITVLKVHPHQPTSAREINWTPDETKLLVELYRDNVKYLICDFSSPGTSHRGRLDAWDPISAYPSADRTVKECQKRWQTVQSLSRTKIPRYNEATNKTGKNFVFLEKMVILYTHPDRRTLRNVFSHPTPKLPFGVVNIQIYLMSSIVNYQLGQLWLEIPNSIQARILLSLDIFFLCRPTEAFSHSR